MRKLALVAARPTPTGEQLSRVRQPGLHIEQMTPACALAGLVPGDIAVGRFDVRPTVDGVDDGIWVLGALEARGVTVLNGAAALLASHDKLLTARLLRLADVPHPRTRVATPTRMPIAPPVVVKPRFGSWGTDVVRCVDPESLTDAIQELGSRPWFATSGAIVQELVPPRGRDLRVLIASGRCVGAISRVAAAGEWRTNVSLGARRVSVDPPADAVALAVSAAAAIGADLVGVDLLPLPDGGWVVLEVNGAVEFNAAYALGGDVFEEVVTALVAAASDVDAQQLPTAMDAA